jgi:hypothetical protein
MATINLTLKPFPVPTEVTIDMPAGKREDGAKPLPTLKLADLSEDALAALCEEFTNAVFEAAGKSL